MRSFWTLCLASTLAAPALADVARGTVYVDANENGRRDAGEAGLPDVRVSNGTDIVLTDEDGGYELEIDGPTVVFFTKPSGYRLPVNELNQPQFYYVHHPEGTQAELIYGGQSPTGPLPERIDFALIPEEESDVFEAIVFGDTQPYSMQEVWYTAHDAISEVIGSDAKFGVSLGDVVGDDLTLLPPLMEFKAKVGVPWHYVHGNHDRDLDAPDDATSDDTWIEIVGPTYYSFEHGDVLFVNFENTFHRGPGQGYGTGMTDENFEWLMNELRLAPKDKLVVMMMHIPMFDAERRPAILAELAKFENSVSWAAHWHRQVQFFFGEDMGNPAGAAQHHHHVVATVCGSWWDGELDELGIPHTTMRDGAPRGYLIAKFDGTDYEMNFKATRRPDDYQMNIYAPDEVRRAGAGETEVVVNFFMGTERSTVEMRLNDGDWVKMTREDRQDPNYLRLKALEEAGTTPATGNRLPGATDSTHLWVGKLGGWPRRGTHLIEVRATDMYGNVFVDHRLIKVL